MVPSNLLSGLSTSSYFMWLQYKINQILFSTFSNFHLRTVLIHLPFSRCVSSCNSWELFQTGIKSYRSVDWWWWNVFFHGCLCVYLPYLNSIRELSDTCPNDVAQTLCRRTRSRPFFFDMPSSLCFYCRQPVIYYTVTSVPGQLGASSPLRDLAVFIFACDHTVWGSSTWTLPNASVWDLRVAVPWRPPPSHSDMIQLP